MFQHYADSSSHPPPLAGCMWVVRSPGGRWPEDVTTSTQRESGRHRRAAGERHRTATGRTQPLRSLLRPGPPVRRIRSASAATASQSPPAPELPESVPQRAARLCVFVCVRTSRSCCASGGCWGVFVGRVYKRWLGRPYRACSGDGVCMCTWHERARVARVWVLRAALGITP